MDALLPIAAKSLLIAGATLLLLRLMRRRSAADRSFVAHLGLAAIAILPLAVLLLPALEVETALVGPEERAVPALAVPTTTEVASQAATFPDAAVATPQFAAGIDWLFWAYAVPAGLLLLFTLIALLRLVLLKAKANVLVEANWLTALAQAQRRMGFKHGTALLTSDELKSPISWGLMRPVILLNSEAAGAHDEAEAIIAHELAHVARLDWVKLLLSRVTVAMFWFNPLVWLLAREAHQLREEAADDAVLGSNIEDTDYARLLVGIARHECRGLLIGAHGVAPARNSLARRVQRVLDAASVRAPGGWRWASAAGIFAAGMAVPLAILQLVPIAPADASPASHRQVAARSADPRAALDPIAGAAEAAAAATASAIHAVTGGEDLDPGSTAELHASNGTVISTANGQTVLRSANGSTITTAGGKTVLRSPGGGTIAIGPPDASGRQRTVITGPNGQSVAFADADDAGVRAAASAAGIGAAAVASASRTATDKDVERAIRMKVHGVTPEYARTIRSASPRLARATDEEIAAMRIHGVTTELARGLAAAGYSNVGPEEITKAAIHGVNVKYAREMAAAGLPTSRFDDLINMRIHGIDPGLVHRYRKAGFKNLTAKQLIDLSINGVEPNDLDPDPDPDPDP